LRGHSIHPDSDRALRELVALARSRGGRVAFLLMPDSAEFRALYPPEVEAATREHLAGLSRELAAPVIDGSGWMGAEYLADGFHLSREGAALFTARLGARVAEMPELREDR
jgi:lysophospholipase L1-like esterase